MEGERYLCNRCVVKEMSGINISLELSASNIKRYNVKSFLVQMANGNIYKTIHREKA